MESKFRDFKTFIDLYPLGKIKNKKLKNVVKSLRDTQKMIYDYRDRHGVFPNKDSKIMKAERDLREAARRMFDSAWNDFDNQTKLPI